MEQWKCLNFVVTGRVQRVGFRNYTHQIALELNLVGFVKNVSDGSVAGHVAGPSHSVETFINRLRSGPPLAKVGHIFTETAEAINYSGFEIQVES